MSAPQEQTSLLSHLVGASRSDQVATYAEVERVIATARTALEAAGFPVKTNSALGALFAAAARLQREWSQGIESGGLDLLIRADEAYRIAQAVLTVLHEPGAREAIRRITKSDMSLSARQSSQGKDALWELDLLRAMRERGGDADLRDPPDVILKLSGSLGAYGFACKKVYSEENLRSQFSKGLDQLRASGLPGVIAFNLDDLTPERSILTANTRAEGQEVLNRRHMLFVERHFKRFRNSVLDRRCDGVLISTCVHADVGNVSPRFNRVRESMIWTVESAGPGAHIRLNELRNLLGASIN